MRLPRPHRLSCGCQLGLLAAAASLLLPIQVIDAAAQTGQPARSGGVGKDNRSASSSRDATASHYAVGHASGAAKTVVSVVYNVPTPRIEALSPRGLRISIPDETGISQVRFHLGVNKPLSPQMLGSVNVEVSHRTGRVWAYEDRSTLLGAGDLIHYWLQVTRSGYNYERAGNHIVEEFVETFDIGGSDPVQQRPSPVALSPVTRPPHPASKPTEHQQDHHQQQCTRSRTSVNGRFVCQGELLFLENFDTTNFETGVWRHDVRIANQPDYEFTAFTQSPANTYTVNSQLVIRPTLTDDVFGKDFVRTGRLQLENCTAGAASSEMCSRQARYGYILPPVLSGRISTAKALSFRYGMLEIRAKLPSGDWIYPELWLLPREEAYGGGLKSGRIQVALARGNAELHLGPTELGMRRLEAAALASHRAAVDESFSGDVDAGSAGGTEASPLSFTPPVAAVPFSAGSSTTRKTTTTIIRISPPNATKTTVKITVRAPEKTTTKSQATTTRAPATSKATVKATVKATSSTPRTGSALSRTTTRATSTTRRPSGSATQPVSGGSGSSRATHPTTGSSDSRGYSSVAATKTVHPVASSTPTPISYWMGGVSDDNIPWRGNRRGRRGGRAVETTSTAGYMGPAKKEVSRTELPGRPWSGGFHNYTVLWTPDAMVFSVDGVELGVLLPERVGGLLRSAPDPQDDPWYNGGKMAPFDREFYISLGLSVGGIHNFPDGVQGPARSKKPWKNTAAKAMLSFWNAKNEWYQSWSTDSALLVDSVRVTAL